MKIALCNCSQIRRWRHIPNTNECQVLPCQNITNNDSCLRHYDFNITRFVLTNKNIIHLSLAIEIIVFPFFFCRIRPHVLIIDKDTQSSSQNNSHKLPIPLLDILNQYNEGSKLWIDVINEANVLQALVTEYLSPTVDSELFLLKKIIRTTVGPFVIVMSLDDNEVIMAKIPTVTDTIIFK